ncbi:MAG: hypothetical protein IT378_20195, partial [Sandaracinaceae bacterium]|nr:hypothetical protein [Sandaracinaceae bacterium]
MSGDELADVLEHPDVTFELEVTGSSARWGVRELRIEEGLNQLSVCTVHARCDGHPTVRDLLHSDVRLTIERSTQQRNFKGIVQHARVREEVDGVEVELRVVPALWLLSQKIDTRIYQEMTVVQIVQDLYARTLSGMRRTVRNNTHATYHPREYTTQYQESCLAFLSRLTEEEGIFWYFDHEADDTETLVLADGTSGLPRVREGDEGRVPYAADPDQVPGHEAVSDIVHLEEIGAMDVVVSEYDWTRPSLSIQGRETGRSSREPALEVYDHTDAALLYAFNGQRYDGDTATVQARLRAESLDLGRHTWSMHSTVVTAQPGHLMQVTGAPEGDLDERYLITRVTTFGSATEGTRGTVHNT